jgi:hypothetical protein
MVHEQTSSKLVVLIFLNTILSGRIGTIIIRIGFWENSTNLQWKAKFKADSCRRNTQSARTATAATELKVVAAPVVRN